jgi:hypothetical protein
MVENDAKELFNWWILRSGSVRRRLALYRMMLKRLCRW